MKAAFIKKTGAPNVIEWGDLPEPKINDNELLVKTTAVPANHVDTYIRSGKMKGERPLPSPYILGMEMVGVVEKVGQNVTRFKQGQRVWANTFGVCTVQGTISEYVAADASLFYPVPEGVDDFEMAAVIQAGTTACVGLIRAQLKATDILFVNGGAGNIGTGVIQLASARGARVFASSTGREKMDWCKRCGAEAVFDYKNSDMEKEVKAVAPEGVDVFWDTSREPHFDLGVSLLKQKGKIVLMAGGDSRPTFPVGPFYRKDCTMLGFTVMKTNPKEMEEYAQIINRCVADKRLYIKIAHLLPASETAVAHDILETNPDLWGKIILKF